MRRKDFCSCIVAHFRDNDDDDDSRWLEEIGRIDNDCFYYWLSFVLSCFVIDDDNDWRPKDLVDSADELT